MAEQMMQKAYQKAMELEGKKQDDEPISKATAVNSGIATGPDSIHLPNQGGNDAATEDGSRAVRATMPNPTLTVNNVVTSKFTPGTKSIAPESPEDALVSAVSNKKDAPIVSLSALSAASPSPKTVPDKPATRSTPSPGTPTAKKSRPATRSTPSPDAKKKNNPQAALSLESSMTRSSPSLDAKKKKNQQVAGANESSMHSGIDFDVLVGMDSITKYDFHMRQRSGHRVTQPYLDDAYNLVLDFRQCHIRVVHSITRKKDDEEKEVDEPDPREQPIELESPNSDPNEPSTDDMVIGFPPTADEFTYNEERS
jgi:hypothetical protein